MNRQESDMMDEIKDVEFKLIDNLGYLINSNWDSESLKIMLIQLHKDWHTLNEEFFSLPETKSSLCPSCNCTTWHDYIFCPKCGVNLKRYIFDKFYNVSYHHNICRTCGKKRKGLNGYNYNVKNISHNLPHHWVHDQCEFCHYLGKSAPSVDKYNRNLWSWIPKQGKYALRGNLTH